MMRTKKERHDEALSENLQQSAGGPVCYLSQDKLRIKIASIFLFAVAWSPLSARLLGALTGESISPK
jgi:hypothetical protein